MSVNALANENSILKYNSLNSKAKIIDHLDISLITRKYEHDQLWCINHKTVTIQIHRSSFSVECVDLYIQYKFSPYAVK